MTIQPETVAAAQNFDLAHRYDDPARRSWGWIRVSDEQVARLLEGAAPLITQGPELAEFLAASVAVWRSIDRLDAEPEGYHPSRMAVELRQRERAAWERYRDLIGGET